MAADAEIAPNWPPSPPGSLYEDAMAFSARIRQCFHGLKSQVSLLKSRTSAMGRIHYRRSPTGRRYPPLEAGFASNLQTFQGTIEKIEADIGELAAEADKICDLVSVENLLLELHATPTDPKTDKEDLVRFRADEVANRLDWGPAP